VEPQRHHRCPPCPSISPPSSRCPTLYPAPCSPPRDVAVVYTTRAESSSPLALSVFPDPRRLAELELFYFSMHSECRHLLRLQSASYSPSLAPMALTSSSPVPSLGQGNMTGTPISDLIAFSRHEYNPSSYNLPPPTIFFLHITAMSPAPAKSPEKPASTPRTTLRTRVRIRWRKVLAKVIAGIKAGREAERFTGQKRYGERIRK
jgi:hypothetical protein